MSKKKVAAKAKTRSAVSKMGAIKAVLATGLDNPTEVAQQVQKMHHIHVTPKYVSDIKQYLKAKAAQTTPPQAAPARVATASARSQAAPARRPTPRDKLDSAIEFCADVGSVDEAKALLDKIERIRQL